MSVEVIGLKEANRALKKLPEFAKVRAQKEMDVTAFNVSRRAAGRIKNRTGFLASKITWESRPRSTSSVVGTSDKRAFYWKFLEYGTIHFEAQHPFRSAAEAEANDHDSRLIRALESAANDVEREGGSRLL